MGRAIWYHVARDLARAIAAGRLRPGARLPATREAAERLGVSDRTLRRAYRELCAAGWLETRPRHGVRVRGPELGELGEGGERGERGEHGEHGNEGAGSASPPGPADVARLAAVMGFRLSPGDVAEGLRRQGACAGYDERLADAPLSRRRRLWLGHDMRRVVRRARQAGMSMAGIEALFRAACEWERYREAVRGGARVGEVCGASGSSLPEGAGRGGLDGMAMARRVARVPEGGADAPAPGKNKESH